MYIGWRNYFILLRYAIKVRPAFSKKYKKHKRTVKIMYIVQCVLLRKSNYENTTWIDLDKTSIKRRNHYPVHYYFVRDNNNFRFSIPFVAFFWSRSRKFPPFIIICMHVYVIYIHINVYFLHAPSRSNLSDNMLKTLIFLIGNRKNSIHKYSQYILLIGKRNVYYEVIILFS